MCQSTAGSRADPEDSQNRRGPARSESRPLWVARGPEKLRRVKSQQAGGFLDEHGHYAKSIWVPSDVSSKYQLKGYGTDVCPSGS